MDYKKILRSRRMRMLILGMLDFLPDSTMLRLQYWIKLGRWLDFKIPKRFTEKIQWYKLNYRNPLLSKCIDKYDVREFVESRGLGHTLNDLYLVCERIEDFDIERLPDKFVVKKTSGGGGLRVVLCKDKRTENWASEQEDLFTWLNPTKSKSGREWGYYDLKPRLVVERLLVNRRNPDAGVDDFKFFCFNGVPRYVVVDIDRYIDHKRNFYTADWEYLGIGSDCATFGDVLEAPVILNDMLRVAKALSSGFPFVRVDLYDDDGHVIFGEMTFYPWSGYVKFTPDIFDFEMGDLFPLCHYP